jgi:hypothetical protein
LNRHDLDGSRAENDDEQYWQKEQDHRHGKLRRQSGGLLFGFRLWFSVAAIGKESCGAEAVVSPSCMVWQPAIATPASNAADESRRGSWTLARTVGRMVIAAKTGLAAQAAPLPRAGQQ